MRGIRSLAAGDCQAPKKTLRFYISVPSLLQPPTSLNKECKFNGGVRVQTSRYFATEYEGDGPLLCERFELEFSTLPAECGKDRSDGGIANKIPGKCLGIVFLSTRVKGDFTCEKLV